MDASSLTFDRFSDAAGLTLRLAGRFSAASLPSVAAAVESYSFASGQQLRLDLRKVDLLDSAAIGALVRWHHHLRQNQAELRLVNVRETVMRTLKMSNLVNLLHI